MVFLTVLIIALVVVFFMALFYFAGHIMPVMPIVNEWRTRAIIYEVRGNGLFPKWDVARTIKDMQGNPAFQLRKAKIRTPPKRLIEAQRGADGKDYIVLLQVSRDAVLTVTPKFMKEVLEVAKDRKIGSAEKVRRLRELDDIQMENVVKDENVYKWKEQLMRETARKIAVKPDDTMSKIASFMPMLTIIGVAIFFILMVEPVNNYFAAASGLISRMEATVSIMNQVQETNLLVVEALAPVAQAFGSGA